MHAESFYIHFAEDARLATLIKRENIDFIVGSGCDFENLVINQWRLGESYLT